MSKLLKLQVEIAFARLIEYQRGGASAARRAVRRDPPPLFSAGPRARARTPGGARAARKWLPLTVRPSGLLAMAGGWA